MTANPLFWLLVTPMICSVLVYIVGRLLAPHDDETENKAVWLCVFSIALTIVPYVYAVIAYLRGGALVLEIAGMTLAFDGISVVISGTVLILGLAVALFSSAYMAREHSEEKFYGLLMALITSIVGLSVSTDLFNIYVWFELMAISTYALVGFYRESPKAMEASVKYLVQSAVGSALIILGIAIIFGTTGEITLAAIAANLNGGNWAVLVAAGLLIVGYGIKCAFVPLHNWLPDAHSQAPSGVSAMLSGIVIEAGLIALLRSLGAVSASAGGIGTVFMVFGALNICLGNLAALRQSEIKRMFAFSSVAHMGYIALGFGFAMQYAQSSEAASGAFFHIFNHAMMKGLVFLVAGVLVYNLKVTKGNHEPLMTDDLNGVSQRFPLLALIMAIAVFALSGLPPFSGFMSKWQIFAGGALSGDFWALFLVVFAAINSVLSLGYYAPLVNRMYRREAGEVVLNATAKVPLPMLISLLILVVFVVVLGFFPMIASATINAAATTFLATIF